MTTPSPSLKPCPFCGCENLSIISTPHSIGRQYQCYHYVKCNQCGCESQKLKTATLHGEDGCKAIAIEKWNTRAETPSDWTYASNQHTCCAGCGEDKHTPLRNDTMGGYVCLTCIDKELARLQAAETPCETKGDDLTFVECPTCSVHPGSPPLCFSCRSNRQAIDQLRAKLNEERNFRARMVGACHAGTATELQILTNHNCLLSERCQELQQQLNDVRKQTQETCPTCNYMRDAMCVCKCGLCSVSNQYLRNQLTDARAEAEVWRKEAEGAPMGETFVTLRNIQQERDSLRAEVERLNAGDAAYDKCLCELWDRLGARGKISEQEAAVERIRDLMVAEDHLSTAVKALEMLRDCDVHQPDALEVFSCDCAARLKQTLNQLREKGEK